MDRTQRPKRRGWAGRCRGQSLVEFAIMLPVMMILVFGIVEFGMGLRAYISLTNATREGARFAAVGNPAGAYPTNCDGTSNTTVVGRVCVAINGLQLSNMQSISVAYPNGQASGNPVIVSTQYTYHYITPLANFISFFTGGAFSNTLSLSSSTNMRLE